MKHQITITHRAGRLIRLTCSCGYQLCSRGHQTTQPKPPNRPRHQAHQERNR